MNEDFVSSKLARKLQEKGYPLKKVYRQDGAPFFYDLPQDHPDWSQCDAWYLPSIWEVLKWLREREIRIDIVVYPIDRSTAFIGGEIYTISIYIDRERDIEINRNGKDKYRIYEQAALAGVNYCLENLI